MVVAFSRILLQSRFGGLRRWTGTMQLVIMDSDSTSLKSAGRRTPPQHSPRIANPYKNRRKNFHFHASPRQSLQSHYTSVSCLDEYKKLFSRYFCLNPTRFPLASLILLPLIASACNPSFAFRVPLHNTQWPAHDGCFTSRHNSGVSSWELA